MFAELWELEERNNSGYHIEVKRYKADACIRIYDFATQTNMRKEPARAEFECLQNYESSKSGIILGIT